jgi:hypothetical protein
MALLDYEKKEGLQYGTVGDECYHCRRNRDPEAEYEPKSLDRQLVYKLKIYGNEYCLCKECFLKTLGDYVLLEPAMLNGEPLKGAEFDELGNEIKLMELLEEEKKNNGGDAKNAKAEKKESAAKKQSKKTEGEE